MPGGDGEIYKELEIQVHCGVYYVHSLYYEVNYWSKIVQFPKKLIKDYLKFDKPLL